MANRQPGREPIDYDGLIKTALRRHHRELVEWLLGVRPVAVRALDTALATTEKRRTDQLLEAELPDGSTILLHAEFQTAGDRTMPRRMARYMAMILGSLESRFVPEDLASVVVYLTEEDYVEDPGRITIEGKLGFRFDFAYCVVKLWEEDPASLLAMGSPGLCLFAPLMAGNPTELALQSQEKIRRAPDSLVSPEEKRELLTVLGGISALVVKDRKFLERLFSEIRVMKDNYFFDLIRKEGEAVGLAKGKAEARTAEINALRRALFTVLERRFGEPPRALVRKLRRIKDCARLESLLADAAVCEDLDAFGAGLS
jgi:predicted transposase YdaD